jgi:lysophospholipase L1-like esterase
LVQSASVAGATAELWQLRDGDRVVFIGNAFIEREQTYSHLETLLVARWPDRNITFRNLGWSGDTVLGEARAGFGTPAEGFEQLKAQLVASKPTVIFVGYGGNEAFDGAAGLERFKAGLKRLDEAFKPTKAKVIVLSPPPQEDLGRPLPKPDAHNRDLALYAHALESFARERDDRFIDLFSLLGDNSALAIKRPLTDDGIHLKNYGYWMAAQAIAKAIELEPPRWRVTIGPDGFIEQERGTKISKVEMLKTGIRFESREEMLPGLPIAADAPPGGVASWGSMPILRIKGLPLGRYRLTIDGETQGIAGAPSLASGVPLLGGPQYEQTERLRSAIAKKNQLFFYRWRPQNETYLFGFRKHEQGQNAREIPQFDPLVAAQEEEIAKLRVPKAHVYKLVRETEESR